MAKEKQSRFYVGHVATQTEPIIVDREEKDDDGNSKQYSLYDILADIKNDLEKIKENIGN